MIWLEELQTRKKISRIYFAYVKTFREDERRDKDQFLDLLENPDCYIFGVRNEENQVGYVILWEFENYHFLEHFEVFDEFRNLKLGSEILTVLKEKFGNIILESELKSLNEMAERRINFYLRNGFSIISEDYIQPSYGTGKNSISLYLLSNFAIENVKKLESDLHSKVYLI